MLPVESISEEYRWEYLRPKNLLGCNLFSCNACMIHGLHVIQYVIITHEYRPLCRIIHDEWAYGNVETFPNALKYDIGDMFFMLESFKNHYTNMCKCL